MEALIQDCRLFYRYERCQRPGAPVLLLLHGWGCDGSIFQAFEQAFGQKASLLIVDFPGHGRSGEPPVPWGVPEYAEQVNALMEQLDIPRADLIAHSFGGRVALYLAAHHPEKVGKMILTGAAGLKKPQSEALSKRQKQYQKVKKWVLAAGKIPPLKPLCEKLMERLRVRYGSPDYVRLNENMRKTFVRVISQDLSDLLPRVRSSTLLVWGSRDTETPLWMGQKMEKEIPDAGLVVFEGRSHFAFVEEGSRFQLIADTFLWGGENA